MNISNHWIDSNENVIFIYPVHLFSILYLKWEKRDEKKRNRVVKQYTLVTHMCAYKRFYYYRNVFSIRLYSNVCSERIHFWLLPYYTLTSISLPTNIYGHFFTSIRFLILLNANVNTIYVFKSFFASFMVKPLFIF